MEHINEYEFGPFRVDLAERTLLREGQPLSITNKTLEVLLALIERKGLLVEKEELMSLLWPDQAVEESNLTQHVYSLRKALGEDANETHYIQTIPRRGYRFIADVKINCSRSNATNGQAQSLPRVEPPPETLVATAAVPRRWWWKAILAIALLVAGLTFVWQYFQRPVAVAEITKLTQRGDVSVVVTAPDAQSLAYVSYDAQGNQGIWLKHIANHSELALVPVGAKHYEDLAFSQDGNYLYYLAADNFMSPGSIYRYSLPGGPAVKVLDSLLGGNGTFAVSPANDQVAYTRRNQAEGVSRLFIASLNGEAKPREVATYKLPNNLRTLSWSPDGKTIACTSQNYDAGREFMTVTAFDVASGKENNFTQERWWRVTDLTWLGAGNGLAVVAMEEMSGFSQLWHLAWPSGVRRRLTNDPVNYGRISANNDGATLMTIEAKVLTGVWVVEASQPDKQPHKLLSGQYTGMHGLSTTRDGRVLFTSSADGTWDIWGVSAQGGTPTQLTKNARANYMQSAAPDGRSIIFVSNRMGNFNIWRMDADGKNPQPLTEGIGKGHPRLAPDGTWFLYTQGEYPGRSLWRRNTAGGEPAMLAERILSAPAISPDGQLIAYTTSQGHNSSIEIIPATGGSPLHKFEAQTQNIQWSPDGKAITFVRLEKDVGNLWNQPLDGDAPQQITFFKSEELHNFDWLPDGKHLVCVRALLQNDVVRMQLSK